MKTILALAAAATAVVSVNAATITESAVISGVGSNTLLSPGTATGSYDTVANTFTLSGSVLFSPAIGLPTGTDTVTLTRPGAGFTASATTATFQNVAGIFSLAAFTFTGVTGANIASGYFINIYKSGNLVAQGSLVPGSTIGSVVPEPSTYAVAAGAALLGFAAFRRARR